MQPVPSALSDSDIVTHDRIVDAVVLRNYDHDVAVALTITVEDLDGTTVFEDRYCLPPLTTEVIDLPLSVGTYRVAAAIGDKPSAETVCALGNEATRAACVETGNGIVSVVDGLD